jgi:hypothetical protein
VEKKKKKKKTCAENYGIQHQNIKTHQFQGKIIKNTKTHKPRAKLQETIKNKKICYNKEEE